MDKLKANLDNIQVRLTLKKKKVIFFIKFSCLIFIYSYRVHTMKEN